MKISIYTVLFFLTFNTLFAQEIQQKNSENKKSLGSKITLTSLDFAKTEKVVPAVTFNLTPVQDTHRKFQVTLAHNLFKSTTSSVTRVDPIQTALYAQLSFRF